MYTMYTPHICYIWLQTYLHSVIQVRTAVGYNCCCTYSPLRCVIIIIIFNINIIIQYFTSVLLVIHL